MKTTHHTQSYSWLIFSNTIAHKQCDSSVFKTNETGIPGKNVKAFFQVEDMQKGEQRNIQLKYGETTYPARINIDTTDSMRAKLHWRKDLGTQLQEYKNTPGIVMQFQKVTPIYYRSSLFENSIAQLSDSDQELSSYVVIQDSEEKKDGNKEGRKIGSIIETEMLPA